MEHSANPRWLVAGEPLGCAIRLGACRQWSESIFREVADSSSSARSEAQCPEASCWTRATAPAVSWTLSWQMQLAKSRGWRSQSEHESNLHVKPFQEALRIARASSKWPPIQERVESCVFIEPKRSRAEGDLQQCGKIVRKPGMRLCHKCAYQGVSQLFLVVSFFRTKTNKIDTMATAAKLFGVTGTNTG